VTCIVEEEGHFIWISFLWLNYKCFLSLPPSEVALLPRPKQIEARVKVVSRGLLEVVIALLLTSHHLTDSYSLFFCLAIYSLAALRSIYIEAFDLPFLVFLVAYSLQNVIVNLVDFFMFRQSTSVVFDQDF
jgi:hypothetical protein